MKKREPEKLERYHLMLFKSDYEWLFQMYDKNVGLKPIGVSTAVRTIVRKFRASAEAGAAKSARHVSIEEEQEDAS